MAERIALLLEKRAELEAQADLDLEPSISDPMDGSPAQLDPAPGDDDVLPAFRPPSAPRCPSTGLCMLLIISLDEVPDARRCCM